MAAAVGREESSDGKLWGICRIPFWNNGSTGGGKLTTNSVSSLKHHPHDLDGRQVGPAQQNSGERSVASTARSLLPRRRRLRLDPPNKLYFPYEPGKQVRSAIRIKNTSKSYVAFKFQTTAPKSCFMRPPGAILSPGESIITTVFKFVEHPENNEKPMLDQRNKLKFKITSLKVEGPMEYVPELFEEHKEQILVEQILKVVFLDVGRPNPQLEKLKHRLAEADAALEARKKPAENSGPRIVGEGLVIDEWKERRERHLARQQLEGAVDSV
ncbi:vesicle-associated protein 4-2-like [Phalaenopsis equestris]|uniref:vesicle-associated protein 4-2-like n=1 Tax=Phalaenopsis equestris TaxID=78828 RepID=UPI0009E562C0|nr:vesicle-associated protein 4-2-like [Phalaenopsis equestris]